MNFGGYRDDPHPGFGGVMPFGRASGPYLQTMRPFVRSPTMAPPSMSNPISGIGSILTRGVNWLTDPEQGANRQMLLANTAGALASIYGAHKADRRYEREREEELRREEEARERYDSWDPQRQRVIGDMLARRRNRR